MRNVGTVWYTYITTHFILWSNLPAASRDALLNTAVGPHKIHLKDKELCRQVFRGLTDRIHERFAAGGWKIGPEDEVRCM